MTITALVIGLLLVAVGLVLVSRFIEEATVRLIFQIGLAVLLVLIVLRYLGLAHA